MGRPRSGGLRYGFNISVFSAVISNRMPIAVNSFTSFSNRAPATTCSGVAQPLAFKLPRPTVLLADDFHTENRDVGFLFQPDVQI